LYDNLAWVGFVEDHMNMEITLSASCTPWTCEAISLAYQWWHMLDQRVWHTRCDWYKCVSKNVKD